MINLPNFEFIPFIHTIQIKRLKDQKEKSNRIISMLEQSYQNHSFTVNTNNE